MIRWENTVYQQKGNGTRGGDGDNGNDSQGSEEEDQGDQDGLGHSRGAKRKGEEPDRQPSKKPRVETAYDDGKIPVATLSPTEQVALSKVGPSIICSSLNTLPHSLCSQSQSQTHTCAFMMAFMTQPSPPSYGQSLAC